jgi:predicted PurR-regulated permease PerM
MAQDFHENEGRVLFWIIAGGAFLAAGIILWPFVGAIFWAAVLSVLLYPIYKRWRVKRGDNLAAISVVFLTLAVVIVPLGIFGVVAGVQVGTFVKEFAAAAEPGKSAFTVETVAAEVDKMAHPLFKSVGAGDFRVADWATENRDEIVQGLYGPVSKAAASLITTIVTIVVAMLTMFFMVRDGHKLREPALELVPLPHDESLRILNRMAETIRAVFMGIVLVAIIQGTLAGVAYWIAGVKGAAIWGALTILLAMIPLLGPPVVYIPLGLGLLAQGKTWPGVLLLAFGFGFISQIDNILKPFIIGSRAALHPMAVFFSVLGGVLAMGAIGVMVGPVLLTLVLGITDVLRSRRRLAEEGVLTPELSV